MAHREEIKYQNRYDYTYPSKFIIPMDPSNQQQQKRSSRRSAGSSSEAANAAASPPSSMMTDITVYHDDRRPSLYRGPKQRQNNPSFEQKQHRKLPQSERSRPDPPECFSVRQTLRYSREKNPSKPRQLSMLPLSHERKPTKAKRDQPSSHKHQQERQQRHQEQRHSQPAREHRTNMKGNSPPRPSKPWNSKESSRTASQRRPAEDLDDFDQQRLHSHPAKSSSFQTHPRQLLQVYKDLRQKQLDLKKSERKDVAINEDNSDDNSISEGSPKLRSLAASSFSCESSSMDGCSENHSQTSISQNGELENSGEELTIDGSDSNSLTVLHDESDHDDFEGGTSQDGNNTNTAKISSPNHHPKEVYFKVGTYHRQVSMEGGSTAVTATGTASEATMAAEDIDKRQLKQQARGDGINLATSRVFGANIPRQVSMEGGSTAVTATSTASEATMAAEDIDKRQLKQQARGDGINLATSRVSGANIPTLSRSIKYYPTFPSPIDNQLLQKQIKYLQHEPAATSRYATNQSDDDYVSPPPSSSQLIIYTHHQRPTRREADFKVIRKRRENIHNRNDTRKNGFSLDTRTGRRWSFS